MTNAKTENNKNIDNIKDNNIKNDGDYGEINKKDNIENGIRNNIKNKINENVKRLNKCKSFQYYSRQILSPIFRNPKCNFLYTISKNFSEIVGEKYKNYCRLEKVNLVNENRQGNIYIITFNSSTSFYLNNNKLLIIEKINTIFGYDVVAKLFIKEIPQIVKLEKKKKEQIISEKVMEKVENIVINVENNELREELKRLGERVMGEYNY